MKRSLAQIAHTEMAKDIKLMNDLERHAFRLEADAAKMRAAARALEVKVDLDLEADAFRPAKMRAAARALEVKVDR